MSFFNLIPILIIKILMIPVKILLFILSIFNPDLTKKKVGKK